MSLQPKETLKTLCCSNGWSYAVLWRLKSHDSMLLIAADAYSEEQSGMLVNQVLRQVHVVGEGIIGQVTLSGKHRWIFSDTYYGEQNPDLVDNPVVFQDTAEWHSQFSAGIETVAVISVSSQSVVQFGSIQKISESMEFVDHIRRFFHPLQNVMGTSLFGLSEKYIDTEAYHLHGALDSVVSSGYTSTNYAMVKTMHDSCKELMGKVKCSAILRQPSNHFTSGVHQSGQQPHALSVPLTPSSTCATKANTFKNNSVPSHHQTADAAQIIFPTPSMLLPHFLTQSSSTSFNNSALGGSGGSTWTDELFSQASLEQQLLSEAGIQGAMNTFPTDTHINIPSGSKFANSEGVSISTPSCKKNGLLDTINDTIPNTRYREKDIVESQNASPLFDITEGELSTTIEMFLREFRSNSAGSALSNLNPVNHLNQWPALPLEQVSMGSNILPNSDLLQPASVASHTAGQVGGDVFRSISVNNMDSSIQNSVSCSRDSLVTDCDGKQDSFNITEQMLLGNELFNGLGLSHRQSFDKKCANDILFPGGSGNCSILSTGVSECISTLDTGSLTAHEKGFFSDHGFEQQLDSVVGNAPSVSNCVDQSSTTKVRRAGCTSVHTNQVTSIGSSLFNGGIDAFLRKNHSVYGSQKEMLSKSLVSSWIESSNNISAESGVRSQPKRPEEPSKITRKRARPGESNRPRPKDRQQIQDRVKELREIVPNGAKCSIDALLDRTIKHMLFLQSVTKYADKLKQVDEPKMIGEVSGVVLKDKSSDNGGGATWAFEVGGQTMVCPIVVEDLNPRGQMLVEMLCEEQGFFLEIADIIRGFGLTILKGLMEVRDDKIWARFVVEANRDITRMDIFMSLVQLLQQTTTGISSGSQPTKVIDSGIPVFTNYQQSPCHIESG